MSTPPNFLDLPWRWQMFGGRMSLVVDNPEGRILLCGAGGASIKTLSNDGSFFRNIEAADDIAKIIASAPEVRRHAQALLNGIKLGVISFRMTGEGERPSLPPPLIKLGEALEKSGAV